MSFLILGFLTGLSLILAIGAQNIFVIEQGLKKEFIFLVCLICSLSDTFLIFSGIFIFYFFQTFFTPLTELILNILLILFLFHFIWKKWREKMKDIKFRENKSTTSLSLVITKTLGFTYLNPHVYSDTVFFLGNFSKDFLIQNKILFGIGASVSSFIFFFILGYLAKYFSKYLYIPKVWKILNSFIIVFMFLIIIFVFKEIFSNYLNSGIIF